LKVDQSLGADQVILSACNTASGDGTPGASGLSGLARAFFYAGAKTLLVSHWPVRDDAAARLTSQTFVALSRDSTLGKADAFRQSVLALLADESDPALAHPAIWAPFVVVGEGR
jgi:CHAT domain-containing protein